MKLRHPETNQAKTLQYLSPYLFDGESLTDCDVTETTRDFNIIYKKNTHVETSVMNLEPSEKNILPGETAKTFVFCLRGNIMVADLEIASSIVSENELCVLTQGESSKRVVMTAGKDGASLVVVQKD
jgi:environmental stress-induced protein Ves